MAFGFGLGFPRRLGVGFSPLSLFTSGTVGAWYDPSDYSTLFQDSAGTTPVTAVEQPVGLMLDKSQGLVLGSERISNGDFSQGSTGWTFGADWSISGGQAFKSAGASDSTFTYSGGFVLGKWYLIEIDIVAQSGIMYLSTLSPSATIASNGARRARFIGFAGSTNFTIYGVSTSTITIDNISVKELPGNHARAPNDPSRPVLRARYNLLTYSEQFDNAAWNATAGNSTVSANQATAPDGTLTADLVYPTTTGSGRTVYQTISGQTGTVYTTSVRLKAAGIGFAYVYNVQGNQLLYVNLSTGATSNVGSNINNLTSSIAADGWVTVSFNSTLTTGTIVNIYIGPCDASGSTAVTKSGTSGIYIWGAQLVPTAVFPSNTYQRIAAATDYATAGFLPYLYFDGSDDSFSTNSIDFSATNKMSVCAGVTKLSGSAQGIITELSASLGTNNGTFYLGCAIINANDYAFVSKGTLIGDVYPTGFAPPISNVLTGIGNISAPSSTLRANGSQVASNTTNSQGTGNYGNYPLFIGRRNNASLPFNGRIYQLVVCGKALSASELASTEAYVAAKTGVTLLVPTFDYYTTAAGDFIILDNGDNVVSDTYYV